MKKPVLLLIILLFTFPVWGNWKVEKTRIDYLLQEIGKLEGVFVRNGTEHSPAEAVTHLKMKMERAMDSWFAPNKEEWTAEMFINRLASESSLSGKPYQIKYRDGRTVNSRDWLYKKLEIIKSQ
ncbi:DUF5329 domain-containing protein [bacterium]|nr:DUF5329 domain-containing protein [bacterium]